MSKTFKSNLIKEYVFPYKIVKDFNVDNKEALINNKYTQPYFKVNEVMTCRNGSYIIIDFHKEYAGGIRIITGFGAKAKLHIRFGESLSECSSELYQETNSTNDHSIRDMVVDIPILADQEYGKTGYRFVRIDFILNENESIDIINIYGTFTHYNKPIIGRFKSDDKLLNKIFDVAEYTVFLNMQENLYEGIKRDRLVWMGDIEPEALAISYMYGKCDLVKKAIDETIETTPLPGFMNQIPTYSFWFLRIIYEYYMNTGDEISVKKWLEYAHKLVSLINNFIDENGNINFDSSIVVSMPFFVDWPTQNTKDEKDGGTVIYKDGIISYLKLCKDLNIKAVSEALIVLNKLNNYKYSRSSMKQVVALKYLSNKNDKEYVRDVLLDGGAKGMSTFMSYHILKAIYETSNINNALNILKEYYGAMLDKGATTFFEDFNMDWVEGSSRIDAFPKKGEKDLHGDFGDFCYKGFRHSLCHSWSSGPIQFLIEYVLGVKVIEAGYKKIEIKPNLGHLKYAKGTIPTPYGKLKIEITNNNSGYILNIDAPKEINIIK